MLLKLGCGVKLSARVQAEYSRAAPWNFCPSAVVGEKKNATCLPRSEFCLLFFL